MEVKDGLPSTDFSRMNREYIKAVAGEGGSAGLPAVTEADNGKILGVVNGAWGAMDAGGGSSPLTIAEVEIIITVPDGWAEVNGPLITSDDVIGSYQEFSESGVCQFVLYNGSNESEISAPDGAVVTATGDVEISEDHVITITGDGTISISAGG